MPENRASSRPPLSVLQIGGLAGPGAVAGGVWAVARMQSAALVRHGAAVELVGGWLGGRPATRPEPHERIFPVRRPFPGRPSQGPDRGWPRQARLVPEPPGRRRPASPLPGLHHDLQRPDAPRCCHSRHRAGTRHACSAAFARVAGVRFTDLPAGDADAANCG